MDKFIFSISIIVIGLIIGYILQQAIEKKWIKTKISSKSLSRYLQKFALLILNPIALLGAMWILKISDYRLLLLPILGAVALVLGGFIAYLFGRAQNLEPKKLGAYIVLGSFTNIGTIGALICFVFLGEIGFAFVPLYKLFEEIIYYGIGFPIAKSFSVNKSEKIENKGLLRVLSDPFILVSVGSIIIGIILNISGIKRPDLYSSINSVIIPIMSLVLLISIGLNMKLNHIGKQVKSSMLLVIIKFLITPFIITAIAYFIGLGRFDNGIALKVIFVLSSMPSGFIALIPPSIYDLDLEFANTCWLYNYIALIFVIPWIGFILSIL